VLELWRAVSDPKQSRGVTQILLGDMNAEPQESAMKYLVGMEEIAGEVVEGFTDAWTAVHPEPVPRSNDTWDRAEALTFPSDAPSKRIDFVFVRP
jgi:endonuclease/exonuclease/phosphatase family metal-dependent hydrolase